MKFLKVVLSVILVSFASLIITGCENTQVSGSVSYGMGVGYGYPMYYGSRGYGHSSMVVVRPPRANINRRYR